MKALILAVSLALAGCTATGGLPSPGSVAGQTKIDEQVGISVTLAYTAASKAAALAIQTGLVKDQATKDKIADLDNRGFAAVQALKVAYSAANASDIAAALVQANAATTALLAAAKGH